MKKVSVVMIVALGLLASAVVLATTSPTIGGSAKIKANLEGAVINAGGAASGGSVKAKQAVASVLGGKISGKLSDTVTVKGAVTNIGGAASGGKVAACQSVGTIGSDCGS
jgi:hypothetical protein